MVLKRAWRGSFTIRQRYTVPVGRAARPGEAGGLPGLLVATLGQLSFGVPGGADAARGVAGVRAVGGFRRTCLLHQAVEASAKFLVIIALQRHGVRLSVSAATFSRLTVLGLGHRASRSMVLIFAPNGRALDPDAAND